MQTGVRHQPEGESVGGSGKEGDMKREIGRVRDIEAERERVMTARCGDHTE